MSRFGPWIERLETIAVGREVVATAGFRDASGVVESAAHVVTISLLEGKGAGWSIDAGAAVRAVALCGDELLVTGGDDGHLIVWDVTGRKLLAKLELGGGIRAIATDTGAARADLGRLAIGTADGVLHLASFAVQSSTPKLAVTGKHALSDGAITAVTFDPLGFVVAGGADGQLFVVGDAVRALAPGGDGGVRAIACLGDGRAAIGCGDGSIRMCFLVGEVEAQDRSGDYGHQAAVRGLALGPQTTDDAGRDQPRRLFSVGEDGALKAWFVDGARRPKTIEVGIGPLTAIAFAGGPVANTYKGDGRSSLVIAAAPGAAGKVANAVGRLWLASTARKLCAVVLGSEGEPIGDPTVIGSALDGLGAVLSDAKAAAKVKLDAIQQLELIAEDEARVLLDVALASGTPEVRVAATLSIARSQRRASRPALRTALTAAQPELRVAAFHALLELEREQPLAAIRSGLTAAAEDVRMRAVDALIPLAAASVIASGLIADALRDPSPNVRRRAFAALRQVATDPRDAIRIALSRGAPDVRAEALLNLAFIVRASDASGRMLAAGALDDDDPGVRTAAFHAAIGLRPRLAARLDAQVAQFHEELEQIAKQLQIAKPLGVDTSGTIDDDELEPLFAALACRHADTAIRGARSLVALGDARAIGAVLQLTRETDPALRRAATINLDAAIQRWPGDERLTTRLVWLLDDSEATIRSYAFDALANTAVAGGASAELDLAALALRCSQEDLRVRALQILVRVGTPGSSDFARADALLGDALDDEAPKVRNEAFRTLWAWHTAEPIVPLARGAASRHADLRAQVVAEIDRRRAGDQATAEMTRLLVGLAGDGSPQVGLAAYGALTRQPEDGPELAIAPEIHLAAMASPAPAVRAASAAGAHKANAHNIRARLIELVKDDHPQVHLAAIEALDAVAPNDAEGFALAFGSLFWELRVRAGELCGQRRDKRAVAPMQYILAIPKTDINRPPDAIRQRAARALADVGDPESIPFLQGLVDDEDGFVREMGARGLATAVQAGQQAALITLLGHADLSVRSWGGEGLAKLGDLRALPVLAGTQRHEHRPLRIGAIVGFVALGPDGVRGLRQGLEDRDREIQDLAFAVIVARDIALAEAGIEPDLLVDAMASPSAEIRFAAARLFERRATGEVIAGEVVAELVGPRKPEKAADMKAWPAAPRRAAILNVLADAIASDEPEQRYAAAQVLAVRTQPLTFWREAARLAGPSRGGPSPRTGWSAETRVARKSGWLRRLVSSERRDPEASELEALARTFLRAGRVDSSDVTAAQRLVFGVYAGLVRQAPARGEADETQRVRRDAVGRLVELAREDAVGVDAVLPVLDHAIGDPHHLVRQAAMAALRSLYPTGALAPLAMAIGAAADLGKAAIDELVPLAADGDERAAALIRAAVDADDSEVRAHAALRLPRLYPAGSAEPQLLAARSRHGDVRLAAITQLASATDQSAAISDALVAALGSEHADLRLRAAVALARRGNPMGVDVLGGFLRSDDHVEQALEALVSLADREASAGAAAEAIATRLDDDADRTADREALIDALGKLHHPAAAPSLVRLMTAIAAGKEAESESTANSAFEALLLVLVDPTARPQALPDGRERIRLREPLALAQLGEVANSPLAAIRVRAATVLGNMDDRAVEELLARLLGDRDAGVRIAAAESLALRAEYVASATLTPLEAALRGGRRELVLPAALGLAARKRAEAFQPLLLVAKAGEPNERERALLALGSLGDRRAIDHLVPLLEPAPEDEASRLLTPAAIEALGRLLPALAGDEANEIGARLERLALAGSGPARLRAITGLRYAGRIAIVERVAIDREAASDMRVHAIEQLGLAAQAGTEAALAELLSDDEYDVRTAAIAALSKVLRGDRTRVSLLALGSPHEQISAPAARYLAAFGDAATLVERLGAINTADVRRMLREGLIRRRELPRAQIEAALRGTDPRPRAEVAWIAGYAGDAARPLADAVATAVAMSERGWRETERGARGGMQRAADEATAWRASLWAARRVGAAGAVAVEAAATSAASDERAPFGVRRESVEVLAAAGSKTALATLGKTVGDADREVRAVASAAAARQGSAAGPIVRALGGRVDATTIAPLARAAWPQLAGDMLRESATRSWAVAFSVAERTTAELVAIATAKAHDPARLAAIAALGRIGGEAAVVALERIHHDESEADVIKLAAWSAVKRTARRGAKTYPEGQDKGKRGEGGGGDDGDEREADDASDESESGDDEEAGAAEAAGDDRDGDKAGDQDDDGDDEQDADDDDDGEDDDE